MSRDVEVVTSQKQQLVDITLNDYTDGVISLVDESLQSIKSAVEAINLMQEQDGRWRPRWGSNYYGVDTGGTLRGGWGYVNDDNETHLVVISGTACKRSDDDGATWDSVTGQSFTAGLQANALQIKSFLYLFNGTDALARYDGTTTLQTYTGLDTPANVTAVRAVLSAGSFNYYYVVTAVNLVGETVSSTEATEDVNKARDAWNGSTEGITVDWDAVAGAERYNVYFGEASGQLTFLTSVNSDVTVYLDNATVNPNPYLEAPLDGTTTGPTFKNAALSGNRIWATNDPSHQWRVWWGGTGQYQGAFSPFYGGGWVDLELGGRERPKTVIHYRDGKGSAFATVLTSDPEGNGSIWQIDLQDTTVGDTTITIPVPVKIVGSVGTIAPLSVVQVRNDIMFFNKRGDFTLGSRPQLLNLLTTDEVTVNIRPDIQGLTGSALDGVASYYYDGKVFQSVPYGQTSNSRIMVFDTERRNWNPQAFNFGVERFLEYTDTNEVTHLLAVPVNGSRLLEISRDIRGDLGVAFTTSYKSPVIHVTKDRVGYAKIRRIWIELGRPRGTVNLEFLGTGKKKSFSTLALATIEALSSQVGWSFAGMWSSDVLWSDSPAPDNFSQSSLKRFKRVNKRVNNIQFRITSDSLDSDWTLHQLRAEGFVIPTNPPSSQKL